MSINSRRVLVTTEPIETRAQIEFIVGAYRARWVVEEFFKALKSGCRFEQRQLESYQSIETALGLFLPIAARLLALRGGARAHPTGPCRALTPQQLAILRARTTRPMSADPTNEEATTALAEIGGHLRSNGQPGWAILGRALEKLLVMEIGCNVHIDAIDDLDARTVTAVRHHGGQPVFDPADLPIVLRRAFRALPAAERRRDEE